MKTSILLASGATSVGFRAQTVVQRNYRLAFAETGNYIDATPSKFA
jgi:hypothetical protein